MHVRIYVRKNVCKYGRERSKNNAYAFLVLKIDWLIAKKMGFKIYFISTSFHRLYHKTLKDWSFIK